MFIVTGNPILMFLGCCIVLLGILYGARSSKKAEDAIKEDMEGTVLLPMLESVFENVRYVPQGYIPKERVRRGDLGFTFHYSKFEGSDYIRADYRNVAIEMSDIQLSTETGNQNRGYRKMTVFGGLWVECNFQREFPADIRLRRSKRRGIGFSKKESKSTNDSFYERFVVQSESDVNVSLFMTPQMMDYIQTLDEQIRRGIYMHFLRNGKLIFALDFGHRTFGVTQMEKASVESLKQQYMEELRYVTRMIDEVMLTPALRIQR